MSTNYRSARAFARLVIVAVILLSAPAFADSVVPSTDVTTGVVIRASASSQSASVGMLRPGDSASLLGSVPNWYRIQLGDGTQGFVSKRWTQVVPVQSAPTFTIDAVDVGTGLGILVRGPDFTLVYDGGSNDDLARGAGNRMLAYLKAVAPTLTTIDDLILSHPHRDHVELLPDLFAAYQVREVWDSGRVNDICGYRAFVEAVRDEPGVKYHNALQDFGTRDYVFGAATCYGQSVAAETVALTLDSRITNTAITLGRGASMTILHANGAPLASVNDNSLVVRLNLGTASVLLMGDSEAGGRADPASMPTIASIEGALLACCAADLAAQVLVVGHHGSETSSRQAFLNAIGAATFIVSSGPTKYGSVTLPDAVVISELESRGQVFRTDANDSACKTNPAKIGPDADGRAGGCDNIRMVIAPDMPLAVSVWHGVD
ncbi:MAG: MBL fold metallo-hydrolase [Acidobacteriota bacterium]